MANDAEVVKRGWEAVARGDWDTLLADYVDDMIFVMPGQNDVLEGKGAFRNALDNLGARRESMNPSLLVSLLGTRN